MSTQLPAEAPPKLAHLQSILGEMQSVLVCFSGGIDSAFLLAVAHQVLGDKALGMTAVSASLPAKERQATLDIAQELRAPHRLVESKEIERDGYVKNGPDRCFHCKTELYSIAEEKRAEWHFDFIANGTNTDDLGDYRPGLEAADNAKVRSPLLEAGMNKTDIRQCAHFIGMKIWDKPAAACLSSRIPYGVSVTRKRLGQIESFEAALMELGFRQVRVRWHDKIARIEVPPSDFARFTEEKINDAAVKAGKAAGFHFITLDLAGYRVGSQNELLEGRQLKVLSS